MGSEKIAMGFLPVYIVWTKHIEGLTICWTTDCHAAAVNNLGSFKKYALIEGNAAGHNFETTQCNAVSILT